MRIYTEAICKREQFILWAGFGGPWRESPYPEASFNGEHGTPRPAGVMQVQFLARGEKVSCVESVIHEEL